jgi:hypothetical protein
MFLWVVKNIQSTAFEIKLFGEASRRMASDLNKSSEQNN